MTPERQVEVVCDGGAGIGYGHVRRSLTLAAALRQAGLATHVAGASDAAARLLPPQPPSRGLAQVLVVDMPQPDATVEAAKHRGQTVVGLDLFGAVLPDVNVVVYPHHPVRAVRAAHVGVQYALIREDVASLPKGAPGSGVLVVLGGGDVRGEGHDIATRLALLGQAVTLVQGPLAARRGAGRGYEVCVDPEDYAGWLARCGWAVTNGGGCMLEALCAGKPTLACPQTEAERRLAQLALEQGALLGIGSEGLRVPDAADLRGAAERGMQLVDGRGAERIVAIVKDLL